MSYFSSSSSSSLSFSDPLSCNNYSYYSASPQQTTPLDCSQNHTYNSYNSYYSSSLPSNHFGMPKIPVFNPSSSSSSASSSCEYYDFNSSPIRRGLSTGDLQSMNGLRASPNENYAHETGTVTPKVGRYSAEERKERIERYRIKRNQRNFQKKITYACRKTLADSRPRVKGRFARNGENETEEMEMIDTCYDTFGTGYENYNYNYNVNAYNNHIIQNNCGSTGTGTSTVTGTGNEREWWKQEDINHDDVFWPNLVDIFSDLVR